MQPVSLSRTTERHVLLSRPETVAASDADVWAGSVTIPPEASVRAGVLLAPVASVPQGPSGAPLVLTDARFPHLNPNTPHVKCLTEAPKEYPTRFPVPPDSVPWSTPLANYHPSYYVAPKVIAEDRTQKAGGWADPPDLETARCLRKFVSYEPWHEDATGMPLNPRGRTGLEGRGLLGNFGPNFAADPIITRTNPTTGQLEMITILRTDCSQWAIPGGMVDHGEKVSRTLARELKEEAGVDVDFANAHQVYQGYGDDRRNTDNAWMETSVFHLHVDGATDATLRLKFGDDAKDAKWMPLTRENVDSLYASHTDFVRKAILEWQKSTGQVVHDNGVVTAA